MLDRLLDRLAAASAFISGFVIVIMMVMITVDALGRKFGLPFPGGLELSEAMMAIIVYMGLMAVQKQRENVFVSILTTPFSKRTQAILDGIACLIVLAFVLALIWISVGRAVDATRMREFRIAAVMVPIWPFRWFIPLGLSLLAIQLLANAVQDFRSNRPGREEYLPEV